MSRRPGRTQLHTTVDAVNFKKLKLLAVELDRKYGDLLDEGIKMILEKYEHEKSPQ